MQLRILILFILLLPATVEAQSSSPYVLNWKTDAPFGVIGIGATTTSLLLQKNTKPLQPVDIEGLNRMDVSAFDRKATYNWNPSAAKASDILLYSSFAVPFTLLAGEASRDDFGKISLIYAEVFLINFGITNLLKQTVKRTRPFVFNPNAPDHLKYEMDARNSFFSGHTSVTTSMYFMTATMFSDYYPNSKWKPMVWSFSAAIPAITGWLRVRAGKHYWSDVITGYAVGALVGFLVPRLHHKKFGFNQ